MSGARVDRRVLVSYLTLRRVVGLLGVLLPVVLAVGDKMIFGGSSLRPSISAYYDSPMRDVFVGALFVIALFLFSYRGYERKDDAAGDLACVFALGVALFPISSASYAIRMTHSLSAAALFITLAFFSLFLFTKSKPGRPLTSKKRFRNRIYVACGLLILGAVAAIASYYAVGSPPAVSGMNPVFWLEALALAAFGFSWFVKGNTLWRDQAS